MALRDKANLAIGYARLQAGEPAAARAALERVRLSGPQSSKALLGAGWADAAAKQFEAALLPWQELQGRNLLDAAVQESYLAVPYAYAELGAMAQAVEYYERAIAAYDAERARIGESIDAIRSGDLLAAAMKSPGDGREGWFAQFATLPDSPESRYLYHLLAGHEFQEGLKNYRALDAMGRNLSAWAESLGAFTDMVETRRQAFEQKLPAADARLATVDVATINGRRDALQGEFEAAVGARDVTALATDTEREHLEMLDAVDAELAQHSGDASYDEAREKSRLARGVLMWKLDAAWKVRTWQASRALRDLNASVYDARTRETASGLARGGAPERNAALGSPRRDAGAARRHAHASRRERQGRAGPAPCGHRGARARGAAQAPRRILDPGALCARDDLRPRRGGHRTREAAGSAAMSRALVAAIALALAPLAAHAGKAPPPPPTLKDLKRAAPEIRAGETVAPDPDRAKELYRRFLELEGGDPGLRTEAMRRLGDLQIEAGDSARGETAGLGEAETREAIEIYTRLLEQQPDYARADVVLYQLSRGWESLGEADKALAYLDTLVAKYPASPRLDEAQFRRGEILFSAKRYPEAQKAYEAASAFGAKSEFYEQSLYKLGWSLFKQSENEESFDPFVRVLDLKLVDAAQARRCRGSGDTAARGSGARAGHFPRAVDRLLLRGRPGDARRLRGRAGRDPVRLHALFGARRPLRRQAALHGRGGQLPGVRRPLSEPRARAAPADAGDRGLQEGRLRAARARREEGIRRALPARQPVLGRPHARAVSAGRPRAEDEPD